MSVGFVLALVGLSTYLVVTMRFALYVFDYKGVGVCWFLDGLAERPTCRHVHIFLHDFFQKSHFIANK